MRKGKRGFFLDVFTNFLKRGDSKASARGSVSVYKTQHGRHRFYRLYLNVRFQPGIFCGVDSEGRRNKECLKHEIRVGDVPEEYQISVYYSYQKKFPDCTENKLLRDPEFSPENAKTGVVVR